MTGLESLATDKLVCWVEESRPLIIVMELLFSFLPFYTLCLKWNQMKGETRGQERNIECYDERMVWKIQIIYIHIRGCCLNIISPSIRGCCFIKFKSYISWATENAINLSNIISLYPCDLLVHLMLWYIWSVLLTLDFGNSCKLFITARTIF